MMRKTTLMLCALAGLMAAPVGLATTSTARADDVRGDIRQDRRDVRRDERNVRRDEMQERREIREGDGAGAARAERQEQRDRSELRRDQQDLARDRAERR
jgi:hypothetical protein